MASNAESPAELSPKSTEFVDDHEKSDLLLSVLSQMQSSLDDNRALLANLLEKSSQLNPACDTSVPQAKRFRSDCSSDLDHSFASLVAPATVDLAAQSALYPAAQSALYPAAQSAQSPAAQSAHSSAAQSADSCCSVSNNSCCSVSSYNHCSVWTCNCTCSAG